jgi:outer membrane protein OmpA-like peptidoglycan-associated protein
MPKVGFILALLFFATPVFGQTQIHGYVIPTMPHNPGPSLQICTPTGSWWAGSQGYWGSYGVALCAPQTDGRLRAVNLSLVSEDPAEVVEIPQEVEEALTIIEASVFFDHDSFVVGKDGIEAVDIISEWMAERPGIYLVISGHTDATGTDEYNKELSRRRAQAVTDLFRSRGIDPGQIYLEWYGESRLAVQTLGREKENRRVDVRPMVD